MPDGEGDDCSPGSFYTKDDCKESHPDECTFKNDDMCPNGKNTDSGSGGDDFCDPNGILGSDQCTDGKDENDSCTGTIGGLYDTCPGGGNDVDKCDGTSDDYCPTGRSSFDVCNDANSDSCPTGNNIADGCSGGADQDECTGDGGCTGGDQSSPDGDRCESPEDSCTDPSKDTPAPPPSE